MIARCRRKASSETWWHSAATRVAAGCGTCSTTTRRSRRGSPPTCASTMARCSRSTTAWTSSMLQARSHPGTLRAFSNANHTNHAPADVDCRVCCSQLPQALISGAGTVWRNSSSEWRSSDSSTCNSIVSVAYGNGVWLALCWQVRASTIDHDPHRAHVIACVPRAAIERNRKEAALGQQRCNAAL